MQASLSLSFYLFFCLEQVPFGGEFTIQRIFFAVLLVSVVSKCVVILAE